MAGPGNRRQAGGVSRRARGHDRQLVRACRVLPAIAPPWAWRRPRASRRARPAPGPPVPSCWPARPRRASRGLPRAVPGCRPGMPPRDAVGARASAPTRAVALRPFPGLPATRHVAEGAPVQAWGACVRDPACRSMPTVARHTAASLAVPWTEARAARGKCQQQRSPQLRAEHGRAAPDPRPLPGKPAPTSAGGREGRPCVRRAGSRCAARASRVRPGAEALRDAERHIRRHDG